MNEDNFDENVIIGEENEGNEIRTGIKGSKKSLIISVFACLVVLVVFIVFKRDHEDNVIINLPTPTSTYATETPVPTPKVVSYTTEKLMLDKDGSNCIIVEAIWDDYNPYVKLDVYVADSTTFEEKTRLLVLWTSKRMYWQKPYDGLIHDGDFYVVMTGVYPDLDEMLKTRPPGAPEPINLFFINQYGKWREIGLNFDLEHLFRCSYALVDLNHLGMPVLTLYDENGKRIASQSLRNDWKDE